MKKTVALLIATAAVVAALLTGNLAGRRPVNAVASPAQHHPRPSVIAAAGRVEPVSEEIVIGSELNGKLQTVAVEEGDRIVRGQVLVQLENGDYAARVAYARAVVAEREAVVERLRNGSREEERRQAEAAVVEARAVLDNARAEVARRRELFSSGDIARADLDRHERELGVAQARYDAARERRALVDQATRREDLAAAEASLNQARAQVREAEALLAKTIIRSPIGGVVLRKHARAGESVSAEANQKLLTIADDSTLRVRVDVDESDVSRVAVGQKAWFTAEAYGDKRFTGRVVRLGQILGRKNIRTDEPTERVDTKILETLVELDPGQRLPAGLRVDSYIEAAR